MRISHHVANPDKPDSEGQIHVLSFICKIQKDMNVDGIVFGGKRKEPRRGENETG